MSSPAEAKSPTSASTAPASPPALRSLPRRWARRLFRFVCRCLTLLGLLFLVYHLEFDLSQIVSPSMSPTLRGTGEDNGDWVLSERLSYRFRKPHRWELVRFRSDDGEVVMKRVVGLPGETLGLRDGHVVIDGTPVPPPPALTSLYYYAYGPYLHNGKTGSCGERYFVLGDDSRDSFDSRYTGPLAATRINGRPWLIVWPPSRFGRVNS